MSYFDQASLVMIPSGYKTSKVYSVKPTDGSGDLAFTRSNDTATRVNSAGLIEKVRTNLATYSNEFSNAAWSKLNTTVTAGQADPFGGTSAFRLLNTSAGGFVLQSGITITGSLMTASVWVKSNTGSNQTMLITANSGTEQSPAIIVTTSWQRVSWSFTSSGNSNILFAYNASTALDILAYGFQLEVGDVMTDYIATTSAAVSVGPVANVPRLDYLNSSCPRLLLEPQRTSIITYSEQLDNAAWVKSNTSVTANQAVSPDGYTNADKLVENSSSSFHDTNQQSITYTAAAHTISVFAKAAGRNHIFLQIFDGVTFYTSGTFNLSNGTVSGSGSIVSYGNGWYRCSFTATTASGGGGAYINLSNGTTGNYTGNGTSGVFLYGAQVEAGAYATSYIPTLGAAVTRGADAASKTGISSLIGQTEGTLFVEATLTHSAPSNEYLIQVSVDGSNRFFIYRQGTSNKLGTFAIIGGSVIYAPLTAAATTGTIKAAFAYKSGSFAFYVNGVQVNTSADTYTTPASMGIFDLDSNTGSENGFYSYSQALLFKTRLSNADLAALTA